MVLATLLRLVHEVWEWLMQWFRKRTGTVVTFDTGKRVVVGRKIAEGGFSFVFDALDADVNAGGGRRPASLRHTSNNTTNNNNTNNHNQHRYALKRVHCPDIDLLDACRREAAVHRAIQPHHPHVMPLLGLAFPTPTDYCYMLFPYCAQSLREVVNQRHPFLRHQRHAHATKRNNNGAIPMDTGAPWTEPVALQLFGQICAGVQALHQHDYSHRDIKLENILLWSHPPSAASGTRPPQASHQQQNQQHQRHDFHPLLMDFGSAGPCTVPVHSRRDELALVEQAASHTTLPYRPPELFDGGVRWGTDEQLDYRTVDVWSLGCTLHALLYGASPFECEFPHPNGSGGGGSGGSGSGGSTRGFRIVECTHLAILGTIPIPKHAPISEWYSNEIRARLIEPMLNPDRHQRPTLDTVLTVIEDLLRSYGHESRWNTGSTTGIGIGIDGTAMPWSDDVDDDSCLTRVL